MKKLIPHLVAAGALIGLLATGGAQPASTQSGWRDGRHDTRYEDRNDRQGFEARRLAEDIRADERRLRDLRQDHDRAKRRGHREEARDVRARIERLEREIDRERHRLEDLRREERHDRDRGR